MVAPELPGAVQELVRAHIQSVEQLEILLLLFRTAPQEWSAVAVSRELRIDPVSAARRLDGFHAGQLLDVRAGGEALCYRYAATPERDANMRDLADYYRERRTRLIEFIFAAPVRDVRVFADAFRLRKKERDD